MSAQPIPVTVNEFANIDRQGDIVTLGAPLPRGYARAGVQFAARDASGALRPTQWRPLATGDDGTVQRALFHFTLDLKGRGAETLNIIQAVPPQPERALTVTGKNGEMAIDTGAGRFKLNAERFRLFDEVSIGRRRLIAYRNERDSAPNDDAGLFVVDGSGKRFTSASCRNVRIDIEEAGPLRAVLCCRGQHAAEDGSVLLDFEVRMVFTAGSAAVKLFHTFLNRTPAPSVDVREIGLSWRMEDAVAAATTQSDWRGEAAVRTSGGSLAVKVEHYQHQQPKRMEVEGPWLRLWLLPPKDKPLTLMPGFAKTHVLHMAFAGDPEEASRALWSSFVPVQATVPCEWHNGTGAMNRIMPRRSKQYPWLEILLQDSFRWAWQKLPDEIPDLPFNGRDFPCKRLYGMVDFGDYSRAGRQFCQHLEHDMPHAFFLQHLRTGEPAYRRAMEETALHMMDVDVCHYRPPGSEFIGKCYLPGGLYEHDRQHNSPRIRMAISHTFLEGMLDYYFMTGYSRALDVARGIADNLLRNIPAHYEQKTLARHHGWPLVALSAMYRATGEKKYLDTCEYMFNWLKTWQDREGRFPRSEGVTDALGPFAVGYDRPFGVGVMLKGLVSYYRARPTRELGEFIVKSLDGAIRAFEGPEGVLESRDLADYGVMMETIMILDAFALAHELTGERTYLDKGLFNLRYGLYHWHKYDDLRDTLRMTTLFVAIFPFLRAVDEAGIMEDIRLI